MTKTMNHSHCPHPATKAARAACRKERAARATALRVEVAGIIDSYYDGADWDSVIYPLMNIFPEVRAAYFDTDDEPDELIGLARNLNNEL